MRWFPELRALALLRRIARALEQANRIEEARTERPRRSRLTEITSATAADFNERWRQDRQAQGFRDDQD